LSIKIYQFTDENEHLFEWLCNGNIKLLSSIITIRNKFSIENKFSIKIGKHYVYCSIMEAAIKSNNIISIAYILDHIPIVDELAQYLIIFNKYRILRLFIKHGCHIDCNMIYMLILFNRYNESMKILMVYGIDVSVFKKDHHVRTYIPEI
jgi:hypothetical protein